MSKIHVFVSFDIEHDKDLYELLLAQSKTASSEFTVSGASARCTAADVASESLRRRIRAADQVIVLCGEHTETSSGVSAELELAQQEQTPYFLIWGRRNSMCTKPFGVKATEGMYSWTQEILRDQIAYVSRKATADAAAEAARLAHPKR